MPFVLDASIAACWAFEDEDHPVATAALDRIRRDEARVPTLWWFEVRNTLMMSERRGRIVKADIAAFLHELARLDVTVDRVPVESSVLTIARKHRLTVYDAAYLELAQRGRSALADARFSFDPGGDGGGRSTCQLIDHQNAETPNAARSAA